MITLKPSLHVSSHGFVLFSLEPVQNLSICAALQQGGLQRGHPSMEGPTWGKSRLCLFSWRRCTGEWVLVLRSLRCATRLGLGLAVVSWCGACRPTRAKVGSSGEREHPGWACVPPRASWGRAGLQDLLPPCIPWDTLGRALWVAGCCCHSVGNSWRLGRGCSFSLPPPKVPSHPVGNHT